MVSALAVGVLVGLAAYGTGSLTRWGAVAAGLFAASIVGLRGWRWAVPAVVFFGPSSALSFLPSDGRATPSAPRRTLRQVLANGGVAWALLGVTVASPAVTTLAYTGFVGALAAASADTWATELGTRFGGQPRSMRTGRRVEPGASGAVSLIGTMGGLAGSATVAGSALWMDGLGTEAAAACAIAGLGGMAADGWVGATLQARYQNPATGTLSERPRPGDELVRGYHGIDNEVVNVFGTAVGASLGVLLTSFGVPG